MPTVAQRLRLPLAARQAYNQTHGAGAARNASRRDILTNYRQTADRSLPEFRETVRALRIPDSVRSAYNSLGQGAARDATTRQLRRGYNQVFGQGAARRDQANAPGTPLSEQTPLTETPVPT